MKVLVRRTDKELPLPEYKTSGAAAMDCSVREDVEVPQKSVALVPLNIALKPPEGHFVLLAARSSLHKRGLMMANGIGIGDEDFSGNNDEYQAALYNFTDAPVVLKKGDRIVQMIILPFDRVEWNEVDALGGADRSGFGTTDL
ncbi:MAG: dUTP diphosphatase [Candidatus Kaiserbacteria bacterium]|nr:dUTP diphosphatase [Candidatus Kaiserbacteria bacterium]